MKPSLLIGLFLAAAALGKDPPRAVPVTDVAASPVPAPVPVAPPTRPPVPGSDRATSRSGQFRVNGADGLLRGTVALMAEDAKDERPQNRLLAVKPLDECFHVFTPSHC